VTECKGFRGCCRGGGDSEILAAALTWEKWLGRRGWDRHPELRWLVRNRGQVNAVRSKLPWELYDEPRGRHYYVARRVAKLLALGAILGRGAAPLPPGLVGAAIALEGWGVKKQGAPAERKYIDALMAERKLDKHPQRIEIRSIEAIDLDGNEYAVFRNRGDDAQSHIWAAADAMEYRGDGVNCMRELVAALRIHAGHQPPPDYRTVFGLN